MKFFSLAIAALALALPLGLLITSGSGGDLLVDRGAHVGRVATQAPLARPLSSRTYATR